MFKKAKHKVLTVIVAVLSFSILLLGGCSSPSTESNQATQGSSTTQTQAQTKTLFAYVGANLKGPVTELAASYEKEKGVKVELTFNNSGALASQIQTSKKGDIFIPGGTTSIQQGKDNGYIDQVVGPLAYQTPVIITPKDNPAKIATVDDLANPGVKLVIPDKDATAIGKSAYKIFNKIGKTEAIEKNIMASLESPAKVLAAIKMGQGNVGIIEYSNTVKDKEAITVIEIDPKVNAVDQINAASLTYAADKELANDFLQYLQNNGSAVFEKYGFKITKP
ncbi:molybdate ABC transporter substrate-binding protein [Dehalobacter sp. DCM]|uniref:molybdate ABC transporter substrate-binding protein n=1 Tax=Dehalobacter sp. DCM TaxID=2907827 RepID=UPI003081D288|nr:molybdate ABC transporter substrate-binding protein [Dehalobacter sp. DCM]